MSSADLFLKAIFASAIAIYAIDLPAAASRVTSRACTTVFLSVHSRHRHSKHSTQLFDNRTAQEQLVCMRLYLKRETQVA